MTPRTKVLLVWLAIAGFVAAISLPLARPLAVGWQCYWLYQNGERQQAEVLHKLENSIFALRIAQGTDVGEACTADTSRTIYEATEVGDMLEVVRLESKLGECELASTLEASAQLLWFISGGVIIALAIVFAFGWVLTRSLIRPAAPTRQMAAEPREVRCPACGNRMDEGYLVVLSGVHWRNMEEPIGMPHALGGLPGTVGWLGRPRLHGFRCEPCEVATFQYGVVGERRASPIEPGL